VCETSRLSAARRASQALFTLAIHTSLDPRQASAVAAAKAEAARAEADAEAAAAAKAATDPRVRH